MTGQNETDALGVAAPYAILEAFIDGARVDSEALKTALADPEGRDYLVDLLALRDAVGGMGPRAWSVAPRLSPAARRFKLVAAAALVVCSILAGYVAGTRTVGAATTQPDVAAVIDLTDAPAAPPPTKVITLRPGVDWTDRRGER